MSLKEFWLWKGSDNPGFILGNLVGLELLGVLHSTQRSLLPARVGSRKLLRPCREDLCSLYWKPCKCKEPMRAGVYVHPPFYPQGRLMFSPSFSLYTSSVMETMICKSIEWAAFLGQGIHTISGPPEIALKYWCLFRCVFFCCKFIIFKWPKKIQNCGSQ